MSSRNVTDDERADRACHRYRKMTPDLDGPLHAGVLRTEVGECFVTDASQYSQFNSCGSAPHCRLKS